MKKIYFLTILLSFNLFVVAQITDKSCMNIQYKGDEVKISIGDNEYNANQKISNLLEIKKVYIKEDPPLGSPVEHYLRVNGQNIELKGNTQKGPIRNAKIRNCFLFDVDPFTLQYDDRLNVYRENTILQSFFVKQRDLAPNSVDVQIVENTIEGSFLFKDNEIKEFNFKYKINGDFEIENLRLKCNNKVVSYSLKNEVCTYKIDPSSLTLGESYSVDFIFDVKGYNIDELKNLTCHVGNVKYQEKDSSNMILTISFFILMLLGFIFCRKYKWNNSKQFVDTRGNSFRILLTSTCPQIGDIANRKGTFETEDGYVYELTRKGRLGKITVKSIKVRICCLNNQCFDLDIDSVSSVGPRGWYKLKDGTIFHINTGSRATPDGEYKMFNGYVFRVFNEKVNSVSFIVCDKYNKPFEVILQEDKPKEGDKINANKDGNIELIDGTIYKIVNKKIYSITPPPTVAELTANLDKAKRIILELGKRPTKESFDELSNKLIEVEKREQENADKLKNIDKAIDEAKDMARAEEKHRIETKYKQIISEKYVSLEEYDAEVKGLERKKSDAIKAEMKAEEKIKLKEGEIKDAKDKINELEGNIKSQSEELIHQKAAVAKLKEAAKKKNMHYLLQVQDTLKEISESFKDMYRDIDNPVIKDGLISPMLKGVSGLSAGVLSWTEDFSVKVAEDSESFFGKDFFTMHELDVKEILAKKFISNIVKSDSFSKFVRLYQLSTVPFIRKQLIEAKMNIDVLNKLYYKVYTLVVDFGYTIVCPRLYEEQYSDVKYQWFNSTNLFNVINLPEEEKQAIKAKGAEVIIDVNQIGFESPWTSRKATAVTPDF